MNGVAMKHTRTFLLRLKLAFSDSTPTKSLFMFMESTGLDEDHQSFRVGNFTSLNQTEA